MPEEKVSHSAGGVVYGHVPDWLDSDFFQKALRVGLGDPRLRVTHSSVKTALGKGENYVSIVYAATVTTAEGEGEEGRAVHRLIVKCLPSNKARKLMSNKAEFFRKEVDMYEVVFPEFSRLVCGVDGVPQPYPTHLWSFFDGERDFIVLKDLRVAGYVMRDRLAGLDVAHVEAALRALARFHAFSYTLKLKEPEVFKTKVYDIFPETMFSQKTEDMMGVFISKSYRDTSSAIREWKEDKYEVVADWLHSVSDFVTKDMTRLLSPDDPGAVLNHGDYWINNMLFRYPASPKGRKMGDESEGLEVPDDVKLLDFQIARVCSPAGDLSYLLATSITQPVRREHWDRMLSTVYLRTFWETLEALGAKELAESHPGLYTWTWLQSEMLRYRSFAILVSLSTMQVVLAEKADVPDMDSLTEEQLLGEEENNVFSDLIKGRLYQARLRGLLDDFLEEGFFQRAPGENSRRQV